MGAYILVNLLHSFAFDYTDAYDLISASLQLDDCWNNLFYKISWQPTITKHGIICIQLQCIVILTLPCIQLWCSSFIVTSFAPSQCACSQQRLILMMKLNQRTEGRLLSILLAHYSNIWWHYCGGMEIAI